MKNQVELVSGPYAKDVSPWLDEQLRRITGLRVDPRDLIRIFEVEHLSITCAIAEDLIVFSLMRHEKMVAAIRLVREFDFTLHLWGQSGSDHA